MSITENQINALDMMERDDLVKMVKTMMNGGIVLNFHGKRAAQGIDKKVRPRQTIVKKELSVGTPEEQARNMIIEGENLQAMVTLYKERGQVDLILTDPPYNTGQQFRYNDKWDTDPNDPDLGQVVKLDDGSRHTKWMKALLPRLNMMHAMLRPNGVLAICIDDNELFHLGMMLDEIFGENNRIGIINWQKSYSPKNQDNHLSSATEYVLIYAKDKDLAKTALLERDEDMDARYWNPDNDPDGLWKKQSDPTAKDPIAGAIYAIQSPFTGDIYYPPRGRHWSHSRVQMRAWLKEWDVPYSERDINDGNGLAILITGFDHEEPTSLTSEKALEMARKAAEARLTRDNWPKLHFGEKGTSAPNLKRHLKFVKKGKVPLTYWADDDYEVPIVLGSQSWEHEESGHSQNAINELDAIIGRGHGFATVKPLKLMKKIIQLWCPPNGLVLDPYAGSGTTGHAVLELNAAAEANRRFILIEQGSPDHGDKYARSLTQERLRRAISGERPSINGELRITTPLAGGFQFRLLTKKIDSKIVMTMRRDELIDLVITSHWENDRRGGSGLIPIQKEGYKFLVGCNEQQEGYFLIWNGDDKVGQLDATSYVTVVQEAKRFGLKQPYHVYARYEIYQSKNVIFYKIPDKILAHLGLNENSDVFNEDDDE